MKYVKKIAVLSICLTMCFMLSGCAAAWFNPLNWPDYLKSGFNSSESESQRTTLLDAFASDVNFPMEEKTYKQGQKALAANDKASLAQQEAADHAGAWNSGWYDWKAARAQKKADKQTARYESTRAADKTFQNALEEANEKARGSLGFNLRDIPIPLLMVAAVILIIILFAILRYFRRKGKALKKAAKKGNLTINMGAQPEVPIISAQEIHSVPALDDRQFEQRGTAEGQLAYLQKQCASRGLNTDKLLAAAGGDAAKANTLIMRSSPEQLEEFR